MDQQNINNSESSKAISSQETIQEEKENNDDTSITSKELFTQRLDINSSETRTLIKIVDDTFFNTDSSSAPLVLISHLPIPIPNQPLRISSNLPSPTSLNMLSTNHPQSLFLQALAKLNESSLSLAVADKIIDDSRFGLNVTYSPTNSPEITPPDSLTSAPPSYSFVLRQMAVRRRPRLMGTFIPSPSFVQHTPPPNYTTAFDIYVDNPIPPPPTRVYNFGFTPIPMVCPGCGYTGMTVVASKITLCTHLCAVILCLLCCWVCAPLPYVLKSCKDVYHYCRNCRNFLGMYCPTNPESAYS